MTFKSAALAVHFHVYEDQGFRLLGDVRIHWAPLSSSLCTYGWLFISPSHIINSASSPKSLWLHVSLGPLHLAGSDAMALLMLRPLLLSTSIWWITEVWMVVHAYYQLFIHSYSLNVLLLCNDSFWSHGIYWFCPSWRGILLCCSPEGFFTVIPVKGCFLFLGTFSWSDVRSKVRDVMCTDCKALWGKFVICDIGRYKINWI